MGILDKVNAKLTDKINAKGYASSQSSLSGQQQYPPQKQSYPPEKQLYPPEKHSSQPSQSSSSLVQPQGAPQVIPSPSQQPAQHPAAPRNIAGISLYSFDGLDLSGFDANSIDLIHQFIPSAWQQGIQSSMVTPTTNMIKLRGRPWGWGGTMDYNVVSSRRLVYTILQILWDNGWVLQAAVDIAGHQYSRDSWLFRRQPVHPRSWMAIHFVSADSIMIIDSPEQLTQALFAKFAHHTQEHGQSNGAYYIKFRGWPLAGNGYGDEDLRLILIDMAEVLDQCGYLIYTSVDLSSAEHGRDSWICCTR